MTTELLDERIAELLADQSARGDRVAFLGRQFDLGLAWVHFPVGCGGLALDRHLQERVAAALAAAGAPAPEPVTIIGRGMAAPVIATHGTPDQQVRHLRRIFTGEEIWCQLFSEPGAGSDVAGLATSATQDGEVWLVNGQKVWTTLAHVADFGLLAARTDPALPKHRGLSYFIVDMRSDGVEARPLRQMTGDAEFNEVFLRDVRVPDGNRLGEVGQGWSVMMTTLMNERVAMGQPVPRGSGPIADAVALWKRHGRDASTRDRLMRLWIAAECNRLTSLRSAGRSGATAGPEGSVGKLATAETNQRIWNLCVDLLGPSGMRYPDRDPSTSTAVEDRVARAFLRSRANSIEGGTSEVMRNIIAERVLGLPREPSVDRDIPWREVPR